MIMNKNEEKLVSRDTIKLVNEFERRADQGRGWDITIAEARFVWEFINQTSIEDTESLMDMPSIIALDEAVKEVGRSDVFALINWIRKNEVVENCISWRMVRF